MLLLLEGKDEISPYNTKGTRNLFKTLLKKEICTAIIDFTKSWVDAIDVEINPILYRGIEVHIILSLLRIVNSPPPSSYFCSLVG